MNADFALVVEDAIDLEIGEERHPKNLIRTGERNAFYLNLMRVAVDPIMIAQTLHLNLVLRSYILAAVRLDDRGSGTAWIAGPIQKIAVRLQLFQAGIDREEVVRLGLFFLAVFLNWSV